MSESRLGREACGGDRQLKWEEEEEVQELLRGERMQGEGSGGGKGSGGAKEGRQDGGKREEREGEDAGKRKKMEGKVKA